MKYAQMFFAVLLVLLTLVEVITDFVGSPSAVNFAHHSLWMIVLLSPFAAIFAYALRPRHLSSEERK